MFIDNKELTKLVEQETELLEELKDVTDEVKKHSDAIVEIRTKNADKLKEHEDLRAEIAKIFIPIVLEKKEAYETFGNPEIKEDKVFVELTDQRPKTIEDAQKDLELRIKQGDDSWKKYLSNLE